MLKILAEFRVEDFSKFIEVFSTAGLNMRKMYGSRQSLVYQKEGDANHIYALFEWESKEAFEEFLQGPDVRETMKTAGTLAPPTFTFLEKAAEFEG